MADFMLLLHDDPASFEEFSPEAIQGIIARYSAWSEKLSEQGKLIGGNKLVDEQGRVMRRQDGQLRVIDGPYSETKEVIGGYFSVRADSFDEVVKLAEDCPHLDFGTVEIRQIDEDH